MSCLSYLLIFVFGSVAHRLLAIKIDDVLSTYEVLDYSDGFAEDHGRNCHSTSAYSTPVSPIHYPLLAFGRNLSLFLSPDTGIISPSSRLTVGGAEEPGGLSSVVDQVYFGHATNYPGSLAFGNFLCGSFRGTIMLDPHLDIYYIEPAGKYFDQPTRFRSIIYHQEHVKSRISRRSVRSLSNSGVHGYCGLSDPAIRRRLKELSEPLSKTDVGALPTRARRAAASVHSEMPNTPRLSDLYIKSHLFSTHHGLNPFADRLFAAFSTTSSSNTRVCNLYLQSDTFLWDRVMSMQHIQGNRDLAVKEITSIFTQHVQGAQAIYQHTVFRDHGGRLEYPGISFRVDHVRINVTEEDCKPRPSSHGAADRGGVHQTPTALPHAHLGGNGTLPDTSNSNMSAFRGSYADENPFCAENIDVTNYLNLLSYTPHNDFCLAYAFTYRDFSGGTLGLAWVAEPSGSGGVCEKHRLMREGSHNVYKSLNTGVVTLLNYGSQVALKVSQLTFAHELGHNFGAKHDDDHKNEPYGCLPSVDDPRGNYLMFASATSGDKDNNNKFSLCSSDSIARMLNRVLSDENNNCFLSSDGPFCGNQLTEEGEQCDCGFTKAACRDQCCHPKESALPCRLTSSIRVNSTTSLEVHCSPTAGECCTHDCQFRDQSHLCRGAGECHLSAYCNGFGVKCPPSVNLPDGTPCQDHTRVCKQGQCLGSICERIPGWQECSLTRDKSVTPDMMCFVSCRMNRTGAACISTFQLEKDEELRNQYPQLVAELLKDKRATRLKPGAPCDNYRGYCDVFHRCRSVEAEGPLARLRDLLFSPQMLVKVKSWITVHWWAVIVICVGSVIAMIVFVKLCAVSTPRSRYRARPIHRPVTAPLAVAEGTTWVHTRSSGNWTSSHGSTPPPPPPLPPHIQVQSQWVWPRRRRHQTETPSGGYARKPGGRRHVTKPLTVSPVESADYLPLNARPTPILVSTRLPRPNKVHVSRDTLECLPHVSENQSHLATSAVVPLANLLHASNTGSGATGWVRSNRGGSGPSVNRPVSAVEEGLQKRLPSQQKLPSKLRRPQEPATPVQPSSLDSIGGRCSSAIDSRALHSANVVERGHHPPDSSRRTVTSHRAPLVRRDDSSVPPPAYDDLPPITSNTNC